MHYAYSNNISFLSVCSSNLNTFNFRVAMGLTGFEMYNIRSGLRRRRSLNDVRRRVRQWWWRRLRQRTPRQAVGRSAAVVVASCCSVRPRIVQSVPTKVATPPFDITSSVLLASLRAFF